MRAEFGATRAEILQTLCLTYREMWPYAYQDAKDIRTVNLVMQEAKRLDPAGINGGICEVVDLMLNLDATEMRRVWLKACF